MIKIINKSETLTMLKFEVIQNRISSLLLIVLFLITFEGFSQCTTAPSEASFSCAGGNGASSDGQTINDTEVYWFTGTSTYSNQVNVEKGGTFIVCGNLTLNAGINIKGDAGGRGIIVIMSGGSLTINSNTSLDGALYNYGSMIVNNDFTVNAGGAQFINALSSSTYTITGTFTLNGATNFSNFGTASLNDVRSNASSTLCLGANSQLNLSGTIANDGADSWSAPSGPACVGYTSASNSSLNQRLTADSDLFLCEASGAGVVSNEGDATRSTNCSSCNSVLPVEYAYIKALSKHNNEIDLNWVTLSETNNDYFSIEVSSDGINFIEIEEVKGAGNSSEVLSYTQSIDLSHFNSSTVYVRIKQVDFNREESISKIIAVNTTGLENKAALINLQTATNGVVTFEQPLNYKLFSAIGVMLDQGYSQELDLSRWSKGIYFIYVDHTYYRVLKN